MCRNKRRPSFSLRTFELKMGSSNLRSNCPNFILINTPINKKTSYKEAPLVFSPT